MRRPHSQPVLLCAALLLLLQPLVPPARAIAHRPHRESPKQRILALEQDWRNATLTGDAAELDHLLSDDYVGISWTGQVNTKAATLDRIRTHTFVVRQLDLDDLKIKVLDRVAIVTALARVDGTNDGTPMQGTFRYTRIYQRQPTGTWKITNFEATRATKS